MRFISTRDSIEREIPALTAIAETVVAVTFCWWIARV